VKQAAVLGEQHPALSVRLPDQGVIVAIVGVRGVDSGEPQPARQRSQVHVQDEPRGGQWLRPPYRGDLRELPAGQPARRRGGLPVDCQGAGLWERNAQRLDHVAERRCPIARHPCPAGPMPRRKEQQ
jgi:hypothetical protein